VHWVVNRETIVFFINNNILNNNKTTRKPFFLTFGHMCKVAIVQLTPSTICHVVCDINVFLETITIVFTHVWTDNFLHPNPQNIFFYKIANTKNIMQTHTHTHTPGDLCRPGARSIVHAMKSTKAFAAST
jgi:hypothetical protein